MMPRARSTPVRRIAVRSISTECASMALNRQVVNDASRHEDKCKGEGPNIPGLFVPDKIDTDLNHNRQKDTGR